MISKSQVTQTLKGTLLLLFVVTVAGFILMSSGSRKLLSVQSGSMAPAINKGDLVSVKSVPLSELTKGDVITFISPDKQATITHRIIALHPDDPAGNNIVTKGDANTTSDQPIETSKVVGKVENSVPYLGHGLDFLRTWPGLILLVYIPALIIIINETRRLAAYYRSMRYVLPEWLALRNSKAGNAGRNAMIAIAIGLASLLVAIPAQAVFQASVTIAGNTITTAEATEPPNEGVGDTILRRAFIVCAEGSEIATSVRLVIYNMGMGDQDVSGWQVMSEDLTLHTFPADTIIPKRTQIEVSAPILENISYPEGHLTLQNTADEQIHELSWEAHTRGIRECRLHE